ncbi:MAG: HAD family phosphatase [Candidatus Omnitrophica bacterium]|nr:HAD family phosphatase [Candidatus Omnitrophota bacterium]
MFKNINTRETVGLIFDVDELLFDNNKEIHAAYEEILKSRLIAPKKNETFPGRNLFEIISRIKSKYNLNESLDELIKERRTAYIERLKNSKSKPCCGVKELFEFIEENRADLNIRIAYATSSEKAFTEIILRKIFVDISMPKYILNPNSFFFSDNGEHASTCWKQGLTKKPEPDIHNITLEKMRLLPSQCIAFEDSRSGFQAAYAAGLNVIIIPNKNNHKDFSSFKYRNIHEGRICKLKSLRDFLPFLKTLKQKKENNLGL